MISILVTGISGRMGQAIQEAVTQNPDTCVGSTHDQGQELYPALAKCDVAIDFPITLSPALCWRKLLPITNLW